MVRNSRRLGTAGKIMFPIPNRRLSKRIYRITASTGIVMAGGDKLVLAPYAQAWQESIPHAQMVTIENAGHMVNIEAPLELAETIKIFGHR